MANTSVTIELPKDAFQQLQFVARKQHRSVPDVLKDILLKELPELASLPYDVQVELVAFTSLSDDVLWLLARSALTKTQQNELATLNQKAQQRSLTKEEKAQQQSLLDAYDRMLVRRAQAAALLKTRGYNLSNPAVLQ